MIGLSNWWLASSPSLKRTSIPPANAASDKFDRGQWEHMARETAVSQVEGQADDGHLIRAAPAIGQVAAWLKQEFLGVEFVVETIDMIFDVAVFNRHAQVAQACLKQFVAHGLPPVHDR